MPKPKLDPDERERLAILIEECAEVIQIACKILRHGYESYHPNRPEGPNNRGELEKELGDVRYAMIAMATAGDVYKQQIHEWAHNKAKDIRQYLHFQSKEFLDDVEEECKP